MSAILRGERPFAVALFLTLRQAFPTALQQLSPHHSGLNGDTCSFLTSPSPTPPGTWTYVGERSPWACEGGWGGHGECRDAGSNTLHSFSFHVLFCFVTFVGL